MKLGDLLQRELARSVAAFLAADGRLLDSGAGDQLHEARVALRRVSSQLRTFGCVLDPGWTTRAVPDIRWYLQLLGAVREIDVTASLVLARPPGNGDRHAAALLTTVLARDRSLALAGLLRARDTPRYARLLRALGETGTAPPLRARAARDASEVLPALVARARRDLRAAAKAARREPTAELLHRVRIRAKTLRYAAEMAVPALGAPAGDVARQAARLQGQLGDQRDATHAALWLGRAAERVPEAAFLAGRLSVAQHRRGDELLDRWWKRYRAVEHAWRKVPARGGRHARPPGKRGASSAEARRRRP